MFEPNLSQYPWGAELSQAAARGPDEALRVARRVRSAIADELADELALELVDLLRLRVDPPGLLGSLVAAAGAFAGPRAIALAGQILRDDLEGATWKVERGLEILERNRGREAAIQLHLCARDAHEFAVLHRSREVFRGYTSATRELMSAGEADTPPDHLERYLALGLEKAMLEGARFGAADFSRAASTPARASLCRVVWARYRGRRVEDTFMLDPDGTGFVSDSWDPVVLAPSDTIGAPHPAELHHEARGGWGVTLADSEIPGLFGQLDREVVVAEPRFRYGELQRDAPHWDLSRFLYQNGWDRDRESRVFDLKFRGGALALHTRVVDGDLRRMERLTLARPSVDRDSAEDDIIYSEGIAAAVRLLEEFAPDLI